MRKIIQIYTFYIVFICNIPIYAEVFEGYTLFSPFAFNESQPKTYLINNDYEIIQTWVHEYGPASMPYLLPDSSIIYPYRVPNPTMESGGVGGGIQKQTWHGEIVWEYIFSNNTYQHHHDIEPLPSGNILIIVWEKKTAQEAYSMGRESIANPLNQMWSTAILELNPNNGEIVWEWHLWDHLIQDYDINLPGYGIISDHPELFDINCGLVGNSAGGPQVANADWMHINSIHYNPSLDQIIISSRLQNEIFIIDHSTTSEEAANHSGGNSGKGGDFLYRWGNPENYDRGTSNNKILGWQHSVNWINPEYPGGGNIIIFNNNHFPLENNNSAIIEITPPLDEYNNYILIDNNSYGPENIDWLIEGEFETPIQGGAFRLPNGNTLITQTHTSKIIEVDIQGNIIWEYQYESELGSSWIARAQKYGLDYLLNNILGDINGDQMLNILDIVSLANLVLSNGNYSTFADINTDNTLNILDVVALVNLILYE